MKIAIMFSGQGSQYIGMGKELYDTYSSCKEIFDEADDTLQFSLSKMCFEENEELIKTENTQPAILTMSIAALSLIQEKVTPHYVLGLSLGEYSALVASGAISFHEAVALVKKRGRFMTEAVPFGVGAMTAIMGADRAVVEEVCLEAGKFGVCTPANYNMPGQIVIAGEKQAIEKAEEIAKSKGIRKTIRLNVSGPFHTSLLEPAALRLNEELKKISLHPMKYPVITNLTGELIPSKEDIIPTLTKQVMSPVMWEDSINFAISKGVDTFIEVGPGKTLCSFVKKINKEVNTYNLEDIKTYENLSKMIG